MEIVNYKLFADAKAAAPSGFHLPPDTWKHGANYRTMLIDCNRYIQWATRIFQAAGGVIQHPDHTIKSFQDDVFNNVHPPYKAVFNCAGLGSLWPSNFPCNVSIREHVLCVRVPWQRRAVYDDLDTYVISSSVGDRRLYDSNAKHPDEHDRASILERCERPCPGISQAPVVRDQFSMRLQWSIGVRVECELVATLPLDSGDGKKRLIVHNYGHGFSAVCTSPGTARYAVDLALKALEENDNAK